jgi:hypothetical protein
MPSRVQTHIRCKARAGLSSQNLRVRVGWMVGGKVGYGNVVLTKFGYSLLRLILFEEGFCVETVGIRNASLHVRVGGVARRGGCT